MFNMATGKHAIEEDDDPPDLFDSLGYEPRLAVYYLGRGKWVCHDSHLQVTAALPDADSSSAYEVVFLDEDAVIINTLTDAQLEPFAILEADVRRNARTTEVLCICV